MNRSFTFGRIIQWPLLWALLSWPSFAASESTTAVPPRIALQQAQIETVQLAVKAKLISNRSVYQHSDALATDSNALLNAHILFEKGCQSLVLGRREEALELWKQSGQLLGSLPSDQREYLRRSLLTNVYSWTTNPDQPLPEPQKALESLNAVIDGNPLPSTESLPKNQLLAEFEITSAYTVLRAFGRLNAAPRTLADQKLIIQETMEELATNRSLITGLMDEYPDQLSHEVLLDQIVFRPQLGQLHQKLLLTLEQTTKALPATLYPAWSSLLAGWEAIGSEGSHPKFMQGASTISVLDREAQFDLLAAVIKSLENSDLPWVRKSMAHVASELSLKDLEHPQSAIPIADVMIDGGYSDKVSVFLQEAQSSKLPSAEFRELKLKSLFSEQKYKEVIDYSNTHAEDEGKDPQLFWWRGRAFAGLQNYPESLRELTRFLELCPQSPDAPNAVLLAGMMALNMRQPAQAQTFFKLVVSRYPRSEAASKASQFLTTR